MSHKGGVFVLYSKCFQAIVDLDQLVAAACVALSVSATATFPWDILNGSTSLRIMIVTSVSFFENLPKPLLF